MAKYIVLKNGFFRKISANSFFKKVGLGVYSWNDIDLSKTRNYLGIQNIIDDYVKFWDSKAKEYKTYWVLSTIPAKYYSKVVANSVCAQEAVISSHRTLSRAQKMALCEVQQKYFGIISAEDYCNFPKDFQLENSKYLKPWQLEKCDDDVKYSSFVPYINAIFESLRWDYKRIDEKFPQSTLNAVSYLGEIVNNKTKMQKIITALSDKINDSKDIKDQNKVKAYETMLKAINEYKAQLEHKNNPKEDVNKMSAEKINKIMKVLYGTNNKDNVPSA